MTLPARWNPDDEGRIAVEFVMWVPAVLLFFALAMVAGRVITASNEVTPCIAVRRDLTGRRDVIRRDVVTQHE